MEQRDETQPEETKKQYRKPELFRFPLRAEEAVLGFCKTASTGGPNVGNCAIPSACFSQGS
ncbi:MAG TPA: hypothetical protein VM534_05400 [Thermoanaerobaculia bacterium]|nr:hypothetical protein [Thermoanaerobaculia bacterium]